MGFENMKCSGSQGNKSALAFESCTLRIFNSPVANFLVPVATLGCADSATNPPFRTRAHSLKHTLCALALCFLGSVSMLAAAAVSYEANWGSLRDIPVPTWFDDAKFGIFIHWGPYSVVGFNPGYNYAEHFPQFLYRNPEPHYAFLRQQFGAVPPVFGYKDLVPLFRAERFDPAGWAKLFHDVGARYVILTGEHHDGFALWESRLTPWNAVQKGPRKDLVGLLGEAVRAAGMKYGVSFHRERHYWFFAKEKFIGGTPHDDIAEEIRRDPEAASLYGPFQFSDAFLDDFLRRWEEITEKYHPDFMWIDAFASQSLAQWARWHAYGAKLIAGYLNQATARKQPVYFNNKGRTQTNWPRAEGLGCREADNLVLDVIGPKWQNPAPIGKSFGYSRAEEERDAYKSPTELIHLLCEVVSKNGNLLLGIGPRADGTIPEGMRQRLLAIGRWLATNGAAIYGTRPWRTFGEAVEKDEPEKSGRKDGERPRAGIHFTARKNTVYAILLEWPADRKVMIKSLAAGSPLFPATLVSVSLLGSTQPVKWVHTSDGLEVELPAERPCESAWVIKVNHREPRETLDPERGARVSER